MKTIKNIFIVIIFGAIVAFCLYIAPNYKKDKNEGKINLVINYSNVTGKMDGEVIQEKDKNNQKNYYISFNDIENYIDNYIYYDEQYNYIIIAKNGKLACFDIKNNKLDINDNEQYCKILQKNGEYYIPINLLKDVYNIDVNFKSNTLIIETLDDKLETAKVNENIDVRYKNTIFSKSLEKLSANTKVVLVPNEKNINYNGWSLIRTENGKIGYIEDKNLKDIQTERKEKVVEQKTISMAWEYFSKVAKAPQNDANVKYDGVNVVSPSFFYIEDGQVKENVGTEGINYINWAKGNNYKVWAMVQNNNDSNDKKDEFSEWINDYKKRKEIIDQISDYVTEYKLDGINIDFENIYKDDKNSLSRFIIELKAKLENDNAKLSVDVTEPDGSDSWSLCFDRKVIGDISDYIVFMGYDQNGKSSKKSGSVASYNWVEKNVSKFINQEGVKPEKLILGIPFYSRIWQENSNGITSVIVSMKNEEKYIKGTKKWLENEKQNYVEYELNGSTYKMWIEDEDSIKEKLGLIKKYNLTGAAYWQKGFEKDDIWPVIKQELFGE